MADSEKWDNLPWYKKAGVAITHPFAFGKIKLGTKKFAKKLAKRRSAMAAMTADISNQYGDSDSTGTDAAPLPHELMATMDEQHTGQFNSSDRNGTGDKLGYHVCYKVHLRSDLSFLRRDCRHLTWRLLS